MKNFIVLFSLLLIFAGPSGAQQGTSEDDAVRAVIANYVKGWREGDRDLLAQVFDLQHGHVIWRTNDGEISSMPFGDLVERSKPGPGYGDPYVIDQISIVDDQLATVHFNVNLKGRGAYTNVFTLYKAGAGWTVVTKAFSWRPGDQVVSNQ